METFEYRARDLSGGHKEGVMRAGSQNEVLTWLRSRGLIPIEARRIDTLRHAARQRSRVLRDVRVKSADMAAFCWQMTTLVEGGVPAARALDTIAKDIDNAHLGLILREVSERMKKGESFSSSVAGYPRTFNNLFCAMITVSETGGSLPAVLQKLGVYYDEKDKLARKVQAAIAYPVFAIGIITLILAVIMIKIVPTFKTMFADMGADLPVVTQIFLSVYDSFIDNLLYFAASIGLLVFGFIAYGRTEKGQARMSRIALAIPLIGKIISQSFVAMFCRTAATLLAAGVSIVDALDVLSEMSSNTVIRSAIVRARSRVIGGSSVSAGLATSNFFPNMLISMVSVGEESGALPTVLDRTSEYYERKVDSTVTTLMSLLEPMMVVIVGAIVLVVVLALYLPIFSRMGGM